MGAESLDPLDGHLAADLHDLVGGQAEEVADMDGVALHDREYPLLPGRQAVAVVAMDHGFVPDIIGHVVDVDRAAQRLAGGEQLWNVGTLHEAEARFGTPKVG